MRASLARFIALLAGTFALVLAGGCGDQGRGADAEEIEAVIAQAWTATDPAVRCGGAFTRAFVVRVHGTPTRCRKTRAPGLAGELKPGGRANATAVNVQGDRATAIVSVRGGGDDGARGQISLAKEDGAWKVSDLGVGFLRSQLDTKLNFARLGEETTSYVELTCIGDAFDALGDAMFQTVALRALAGAAPDPRFVEVFTTCTGNPDQPIPVGAPAPGHALGGRLTITRSVARPGDVLRLGVLNLGDRTITYGLPVRVGRLVNGRWRDATKAIYGTSQPGFTRQAINVAPGKYRRYRADQVRLPATVQPGTYRILKRVRARPGAHDVHATLGETFVVR